MAEMRIAGEAFNVQVDGPERAPAIMLSNSLGTNLHMWDGQIGVLTKHFKVIRYDSRGHGKSPVSGGAYSIAGLGRDAVAIMDAMQLDRVHWLGLSMGGMVGQWLLTNARERIGRAILANTAANMSPPDIWNTRIRTVLSQGMGAIIPAVMDRWFTLEFQARAPTEMAKVVAMLRSTPAHGYAGCCGAIRDMDQRESIRGISNPVLVIVGQRDPATTPEAGAYLASAIRDAKLVTLDAAHLSNIEAEAAFNKAIAAFLTDASGRFAPPPRQSARRPAAKTVAKAPAAKTKARAPAAKNAAPRTSARKAVGRKAAGHVATARKASAKAAKAPARKTAKKSAKPAARKPAAKTSAKTNAKKRAPAKGAARSRR